MKTVSLGKLTTLISSGSTPLGGAKIYLSSGPVMLVRSQNVLMRELNLDDVAFITEEVASKMKRTVVKANDVLLNITGASIGRVATFELQGVHANVNQHVCIIRTIPELLHHRYLLHFIAQSSFQERINSTQHGGTRQALTFSQIRDFEIPLPPLEEQRRIAAILDKADAVRRKRQEAIALTEELLRSAFLEMFGDPVTNPKGWEIVELEQVCYRVTDGTHQPPKWATEGIPFLFVSNIVDGEIDFNVSKYITDESWALLTARCPIKVNDILYTTVGSYGNAALVRTEKQFCFQRHIAHIKPDADKIHPEFLLGLMQSDGVKQQADRQVRGVAQKTLNLRELKKFQVAIPPRVYQEQYVAFRRKVEGCLNNQQNSFKTQINLFNSLLQRAFRGEL